MEGPAEWTELGVDNLQRKLSWRMEMQIMCNTEIGIQGTQDGQRWLDTDMKLV